MNDALYSYLKALKAEQDNMIRETNEYRDFLCVNNAGQYNTLLHKTSRRKRASAHKISRTQALMYQSPCQ